MPDYVLLVGFKNGAFRLYDLKPLINKYEPFKQLAEIEGLYENGRIDVGGYGIVWNDDLDISADGIYEKGALCAAPVNVGDA